LAGLTVIEGMRLLLLDANVESLFVFVAPGTAFLSILIASHFTTTIR
jgi:hypothetical protein